MVNYAENISEQDFVECPLWYHIKGLSQTASGYDTKLTTRYKIQYNGRLYRVYCAICSNIGSLYIIVKGVRLFIR
jgi:hypothetical protein